MNIGLILVLALIGIALCILFLAAQWKVFQRAGKPGWASIIPFYSGWTLAKIGGKPAWWGLVASLGVTIRTQGALPLGLEIILGAFGGVVLVLWLLISFGVARNFGKSTAFGLMLGIVPFIGYPILAFGKNKYKLKKHKEQPSIVASTIIAVTALLIGGLVLVNHFTQDDHSAYSQLASVNYANTDVHIRFNYPSVAKLDSAAIKGQQVNPTWFQTPLVYDSKDYAQDPNVTVLANYADVSAYLQQCHITSAELLGQLQSPHSCFVSTINQQQSALINKYLFANCDTDVVNVAGERNLICTANYPEQDGTRLTTVFGVRGDTLYFLQLGVMDSVWGAHKSVWSAVEKSFTY